MKTKNTFFKKLLLFIIITAVILLFLNSIMPGLIWTKNLGIKYSSKDYNRALEKFSQEESVELSSEELTALFNNKINFCETKNIQIKVNENDTLEISSNSNLDCIINKVSNGVYSKEDIFSFVPGLSYLPSNINFYIILSGYVIDNKVYLDLKSVFAQGIEIPYSIVNSTEAKSLVVKTINQMINNFNNSNNTNFIKISIKNQKIILE